MIIVYDLETLPTHDENIIEDIRAGVQKKQDQRKRKWDDEAFEEEVQKSVGNTSFDGARGSIVTIGFAIDEEPAQAFSVGIDGDEADVIRLFFNALKEYRESHPRSRNQTVYVCHNMGFDQRFLWQRAVVNDVNPNDYGFDLGIKAKPWEDTLFDTMTAWAGFGKRAGLDKVAKALGLGQKTEGVDGSKVAQYVAEGRVQEVNDYCKEDVELTRDVYKRLRKFI